MPSNFDWIFKRDPYAAERERASGYVNPPQAITVPPRRIARSGQDGDAAPEKDVSRVNVRAIPPLRV